jgi:excisionase family DNA binding protein
VNIRLPDDEEDYMRLDDFRELLGGVSRDFIYCEIRRGRLEVTKLGRHTRVSRSQRQRYRDNLQIGLSPPKGGRPRPAPQPTA